MSSTQESFDFGPPLGPKDFCIPTVDHTAVIMRYAGRDLAGHLCLVLNETFTDYHCRFYDILPSTLPKLSHFACKPWVLLNSVLGKTWIPFEDLPTAATMSLERNLSLGAVPPSFVAITAHSQVFGIARQYYKIKGTIGESDGDGNLALFGSGAEEFQSHFIVGMAPERAMHPPRVAVLPPVQVFGKLTPSLVEVINYSPLPVHPTLIDTINTLKETIKLSNLSPNAMLKQMAETLNSSINVAGTPTKAKTVHPLYAHRGNVAVFPEVVWQTLCSAGLFGMDKKVLNLPKPFYQHLFPDFQARERVEGTNRLKGVDAKYYTLGVQEGHERSGGPNESEACT